MSSRSTPRCSPRTRRSRSPHGRPDGCSDPRQAEAERGRRHPRRDGGRAREPARRPDRRRAQRRRSRDAARVGGFRCSPRSRSAGCWNSPTEFMREPNFSPVGAGLVSGETAAIQSAQALVPQPLIQRRRRRSTPSRASRRSATSSRSSSRSTTRRRSAIRPAAHRRRRTALAIDYGFNNGSSSSSSSQPAKILGDLSSTSATRDKATSTAPSRSRSRSPPSSPACCRTAISSSRVRRRCASITNCAN